MKNDTDRQIPRMRVRHTVSYLLVMAVALAIEVWGCSTATALTQKPTVLITGSSQGIGFFFDRGCAERGWNVIATCPNPAGTEELRKFAAEHSNVVIEELDVTDVEEIKHWQRNTATCRSTFC